MYFILQLIHQIIIFILKKIYFALYYNNIKYNNDVLFFSSSL